MRPPSETNVSYFLDGTFTGTWVDFNGIEAPPSGVTP